MAERTEPRDEDRLPWLETVEPDEPPRSNTGRTVALALLGVGLLVAIVLGLAQWQRGPSASGDSTLIAAQEGDYKVRPDDPGGLKVEGEGDAAIATSAGEGAGNGAVDLKAVPEVPALTTRDPRRTPNPSPTVGRSTVAQVPASGGRLVAAVPIGSPRGAIPGAVGGGALVQLGAFPSEGAANGAWGNFAKRFGYLAALGKSVEAAEVDGRTVYRLRVNAGSAGQAANICGRLRVAGEGCFVTS
ncbi:SPOR domain-containing protein [uncultured Sphingomonas sp.]|uniref:SPOR domain-containing protein n=1 Tax=uncultured Sphingomonas sp. TaxID=158754 RepID=UPI0035C969E8